MSQDPTPTQAQAIHPMEDGRSIHGDLGPTEPAQVTREPTPGSLEARIAARREALEKRTTELFDVPGFEGIVQVELRLVGGKRQFAIAQQHERVHDEYQQNLRAAADLLLAATVGFHAVDDEGNANPELADGVTWRSMAKAYDPTLDDAVLAAKGGGRVALLRLLSEENLIELAGDWKRWCRRRGVNVDNDLRKDF